ncbi:MAG TPA: ABC transporter substrate-binding protein [Bradyrhizobium sp.]|nr:ABC transporter substrate-binding protein [Bradyrhizobium sp.]
MLSRILRAAILLVPTMGSAFAQKYDSGATDSEIKLGQTQPYSGPVSAAAGVGFASTAFFEALNKKGGINGRKIKVISLDDSYNPPKTVESTRQLVESDEILAMYGSTGTPTNAAVQKYLNAKNIPQLFIATGASRFNNPKAFPWTMPLLPSYAAEGRAIARYALTAVADPKIAILYQNDDLGKDFLAGFKSGLGDKAKTAIISEQSFEVTDPTIQSQIVSAKASGANVFYFAGTQKYGAMQIRIRYELGWKPLHLVCSTSAGVETVLKPAGVERAEGIVSTAYAKEPFDPRWDKDPEAMEFRGWAKEFLPQKDARDSGILVGYLASFLTAHVLKSAGSTLTRSNLIEIATHLDQVKVPLLLPGITVSTAPDDYSAIRKFQIQRFESAQWVPVGDMVSGE